MDINAEEKPQILPHLHKSLPFTVYDTKWIPFSAKFVLLGNFARGTGALQVYELEDGAMKLISENEKKSAFKCGTFGASSLEDRHLATGDFDGRLSVWNLERMELPVWTVKKHDQIINAIDGCGGLGIGKGAPEIVTGGRDGTVQVWDQRQSDRPVAMLQPADPAEARDCWAVAFGNSYNDEERVVSAGYDNGDLKLFDLRTNSIRWETNVANGICSVEFDRKDIEANKLVVATLESQFRVYDMRTQHPTLGFSCLKQKEHDSTIWCCRHMPQNREVWVSCGGKGAIALHKYSYPSQRKITDIETKQDKGVMGTVATLSTKQVSTQPIISFDWHPQKEGLFVCGGLDQSVRVGFITRLRTI